MSGAEGVPSDQRDMTFHQKLTGCDKTTWRQTPANGKAYVWHAVANPDSLCQNTSEPSSYGAPA